MLISRVRNALRSFLRNGVVYTRLVIPAVAVLFSGCGATIGNERTPTALPLPLAAVKACINSTSEHLDDPKVSAAAKPLYVLGGVGQSVYGLVFGTVMMPFSTPSHPLNVTCY
jgi:hypothetical protein